MKKKEFDKVTVIGLGLIGGSLAWALKRSKRVRNVFGVDTDEETLGYALEKQIIDEGSVDLAEGAAGAEIVVIATHVGAIVKTAKSLIPLLSEGTIITDVGSVKGKIVREIEKIMPPHLHFLGGHPIAGTENSGIANADPRLFKGRRFILTPTEKTALVVKSRIATLWELVGSEVHEMDIDAHDRVFGFVSHLPHVLAYSLIDAILSTGEQDTLLSFAGGGLRDYTRVAASSPAMWCEILIANKENVLKAVKEFKSSLDKMENALANEDSDSLIDMLVKASDARRKT
ncbi:MAG: prephenate dehydrogenase/arogenate dehydrogenase family protein [Thermodesulfobacteriota bacterium]